MKRMIALLLAAVLLPLHVYAENSFIFPLFEASFLQGWLCRDWTEDRFLQEFRAMKYAGFRSLILQSVVDLTHQQTDLSLPKTDPDAYQVTAVHALYPTKIADTQNQPHALEYALQAAEKTGMQIYIGLVSDDLWWNYGWDAPDRHFKSWLARNTADQGNVITELAEMYGDKYHDQIAGFYYTNEFWNVPAEYADACAAICAEELYGLRVLLAEEFPDKPLIISPFYNQTLGEPEQFGSFLAEIVRLSQLRDCDILALQDGAGRNYDAETLRIWNDAVCAACQSMITVWVNNETFDPDGNAISADRLRSDYAATGAAQRHILFSWNHYYHGTAAGDEFSSLMRSMAGDLNNDYRTDAADAASLLRWLSGTGSPPENWSAGDADGSGSLDSADLTRLKRLLLSA